MCSINAILDADITYYEKLMVMHQATKHRGNEMKYSSHENAIVAFNWLKITDESIDFLPNRYQGTIVYLNGFISNYKELAKKYNIKCTTDCDTEFLTRFLNLHNGNKLDELNGFFAVLYWSPFYKGWFSFTDRYGIKQLYKYTDKNGITFISSEVKGILSVCPEIKQDPKSVQDWHYSLGVMTDDTIYKDIKRVAKLPFVVPEKIEISYKDAKEQLRELWVKSVRRNQYDGPSGVFLSGGIDSGIIAKYFKHEYSFSMDYQDEKYSEIDLIKENSTGIHYSVICNKDFANQYSFKTMKALDDLKAGSCYTNFALAELASKFVKVVYSGAGGDEFFGGYAHRNSKPINDVVCRNGQPILNHKISRFKYDLNFLSAVLVVEDRMSGFHTMETRYPLLDNDFVDFALSLPDEYLKDKKILKDISGLSQAVKQGKKRGFSNPYFSNQDWVEFCMKNLESY